MKNGEEISDVKHSSSTGFRCYLGLSMILIHLPFLSKTRDRECRHHKWVVTEWAGEDRALERYCKRCGKRQRVEYFGGDMWRWKDESCQIQNGHLEEYEDD